MSVNHRQPAERFGHHFGLCCGGAVCVLCKSRFPARCEPDSHAPTERYVRPLLCGERLDVQAMVAAGRLRSGSYLEALRLVLRAHVHRLLLSCRFFYGVGSVARWFLYFRGNEAD